MPLHADSKPFEVLRQNAADFKAGFDEDIDSCLGLLDSKLSALICDSDTTNTPSKDGRRLSVDIQFTRAKYDIYVHMKSLINDIESSWKEQLEEMKNSFLENIEILLAKTKLSEKVLQKDGKKSLNRKEQTESPSANSSFSISLLAKAKQLPVLGSLLPQTDEPNEDVDENEDMPNLMDQDEEEIEIQEVVSARSNKRRGRNSIAPKSTPIKQAMVLLTPVKGSATRGRKSILKSDSRIEQELHATPSRSTRKRTAGKDTNPGKDSNASNLMECEENDPGVAPKTSKNVHFSVGFNVHENLEIYSPEINLARSAPRRKTVMVNEENNFSDNSLTPVGRTKSKRKTIGSCVTENVLVGPSLKRIKTSRNLSAPNVTEESKEADLSRGESSRSDHYTPWLLIDDLDGKVPSQPGVYELKVYKAKKSAYIGSCDNLRHKLTMHKLGENSGHKHLDKYLERNKKDVQVRYEIMPSAAEAKTEETKRVQCFIEQYHTSPSYN